MRTGFSAFVAGSLCLTATLAGATTNCVFVNSGTTMTLQGDCTTDASILIPNNFTLNGNFKIITAVDPPAGHFLGAVVKNAGANASVNNLVIDTQCLSNSTCDAGNDRLRGIMLDGAAGLIVNNRVLNINQGASGCQEGNAIEVRNAPFDGTHPATKGVGIRDNQVFDWQKTGIVVNGDVRAEISNNTIGKSATQANLAANSIQVAFGASASVFQNLLDGNTWCCTAEVATGILILDVAGNTVVNRNRINLVDGNADVGIYVGGDKVVVDDNRVFDIGTDTSSFDIGIGNYGSLNSGTDNTITNNKIRCYSVPLEDNVGPMPLGSNTVLTCNSPCGGGSPGFAQVDSMSLAMPDEGSQAQIGGNRLSSPVRP